MTYHTTNKIGRSKITVTYYDFSVIKDDVSYVADFNSNTIHNTFLYI